MNIWSIPYHNTELFQKNTDTILWNMYWYVRKLIICPSIAANPNNLIAVYDITDIRPTSTFTDVKYTPSNVALASKWHIVQAQGLKPLWYICTCWLHELLLRYCINCCQTLIFKLQLQNRTKNLILHNTNIVKYIWFYESVFEFKKNINGIERSYNLHINSTNIILLLQSYIVYVNDTRDEHVVYSSLNISGQNEF